MLVFPAFQTNQGVTILKKHQEELIFTTPVHRSAMLLAYVIQSCNMKTIELTFVSFCHKILEQEAIYNWINEQ